MTASMLQMAQSCFTMHSISWKGVVWPSCGAFM